MKQPPFPTKEDLIKGWIHLQRSTLNSQAYEESFWSCMLFMNLCEDFPEDTLNVIKAILKTNDSMEIIGPLAAGPLEDLIAKHGSILIDDIEREARACPKFNKTLGGVWKSNTDEAVWKRIENVRKNIW